MHGRCHTEHCAMFLTARLRCSVCCQRLCFLCSLEYIVDDELVEVTPKATRMRKNPNVAGGKASGPKKASKKGK